MKLGNWFRFLVEHCGLNRMGKRRSTSRSTASIFKYCFDGLTKAGFSVVVCEQTGRFKMDEKQDSLRRLSLPVLRYIPTVLRWIGIGHMQFFPILLLNLALSPPKQDLWLSKFIPMYEQLLFVLGAYLQKYGHIILKRYGGRFNRLFVHESLPKVLKSWQIGSNNAFISGYTVLQFPFEWRRWLK